MRILVLCRRVPYPLTNGESLRIFNYARHLASDHELDLVCMGDDDAAAPALLAVFKRVEVIRAVAAAEKTPPLRRLLDTFKVDATAPSFPAVEAHLAQVLRERHYDAIWTSTDMARTIPGGSGIPVLTDVCDDGVLLLRRELARTEGPLPRLRVWKRLVMTRRFERRYFAPTDACLFVSESDAASFRDLAPGSRIEVIPNGVDASYFAPDGTRPEPATIVFEGSMDFEPNADAAVYLCRELLPRIHARRPDVKVLLVGRDPTPEVRALASDSVTVTGRVDDVRPYLSRAAVFACPLRMGAGIKNKILQAWSMGKAVVATPVSVGGLDYEDGVNLVVRDGSSAIVDALLELLDDPQRCADIGRRARETVENAYRWEARTAQLDKLLTSIAAPRLARAARLGREAPTRNGMGSRRIVMIALQFPPYGFSTGRLRTLSFVRHLPADGWVPIVVTAREAAFTDQDPKTLRDVPEGTRVVRASGGDLARLPFFRGVYPRWMATPDRWVTWAIGAARAAVQAVRGHNADALWLTFPVPSAVLAGLIAHWLHRVPLIGDLRDPMVYEGWPERAVDRVVYAWLERRLVHAASAVVLTTPGACELYRARYPHLPADRFREIPNGIDDDVKGSFQLSKINVKPRADGPIVLLHSGLVEVPDRDPTALFIALRRLADAKALPARGLRVVLRATGRDALFEEEIRRQGIGSLVDLAPRLPHSDAMAEMHAASALLLLQGAACNRQIPAKAYEYLASQRPIVLLGDARGDTHALVSREWGVPYCADLSDPASIEQVLRRFFADHEQGRAFIPPTSLVQACSRQAHAHALARVLDEVCGDAATAGARAEHALVERRVRSA